MLQSTRGRVRESIFGINSNDSNPKFKTETFGDLDLDIVWDLVLKVRRPTLNNGLLDQGFIGLPHLSLPIRISFIGDTSIYALAFRMESRHRRNPEKGLQM